MYSRVNDTYLPLKKRSQKKLKLDESCFRNQCRISCGSDIVIEHVLPYLVRDELHGPTWSYPKVTKRQPILSFSVSDSDEENSVESWI